MRADIAGAHHVIIGSYMFDNEALTSALERRLADSSDFDLTVMVDREMFLLRQPVRQRPRLDRLRRAYAQVLLCRGLPPLGSFHYKAVVLDRRTAYLGTANLTYKAEAANEELCWRLRGPPVLGVLARLETQRQRGQLWDGTA